MDGFGRPAIGVGAVARLSRAPWTGAEVAALEARQRDSNLHEYTCVIHGTAPLNPRKDGWHCPVPNCDFQQDWALKDDVENPYWWQS